jgi:SAM-dependent methyltransferase
MKAVLESPRIYQLYQEIGGFFSARVNAILEYVEIAPRARIIDIGCGPGHIVKHLPADVDYIGFDIDGPSIAFAKAHFGALGQFEARAFDAQTAEALAPADIVMMNGVMHHVSDDELADILTNVRAAMKDDGVLFTLDGCYAMGQPWIAKWLLDNDRGVHVRDAAGYRKVLEGVFDRVDLHIRDDLSRLPYTFAIGIAKKRG